MFDLDLDLDALFAGFEDDADDALFLDDDGGGDEDEYSSASSSSHGGLSCEDGGCDNDDDPFLSNEGIVVDDNAFGFGAVRSSSESRLMIPFDFNDDDDPAADSYFADVYFDNEDEDAAVGNGGFKAKGTV
jgi:hypothetical protein